MTSPQHHFSAFCTTQNQQACPFLCQYTSFRTKSTCLHSRFAFVNTNSCNISSNVRWFFVDSMGVPQNFTACFPHRAQQCSILCVVPQENEAAEFRLKSGGYKGRLIRQMPLCCDFEMLPAVPSFPCIPLAFRRFCRQLLPYQDCATPFMLRPMRFFLTSTLITLTRTTSPTLRTSRGCLIYRSVI